MMKPRKPATLSQAEQYAGISEASELVDATKENAAPFDAAWNPQYALFRKFMQKTGADSEYKNSPSSLARTTPI
ncbi:hypothetical protein [Collimonas sp.]|jgi:hypothetical protein|uniref:hypothetical protein n=1 Tax=Collimonas sp. TaxID=1963772 RepID=UPI002B52C937|nr:hypothetical protein [Collimonas sp.]HWW04127.1 hypothetical protein [Collimonas sp.]